MDLINLNRYFLKTLFVSALLLLVLKGRAQQKPSRITVGMNEGWQFRKEDSISQQRAWQTVRLPHTWNAEDVMDDVLGYYRGAGWYKKTITLAREYKGKEISVYFEGANQETELFVNGQLAGKHTGGYTGFAISITKFLKPGRNELLVKVDNSHNEQIPPLSADFTFYGGIYRDVFLVATNPVHFNTSDAGSNGVYITTPSVTKDQATVNVRSKISNETAKATTVEITTSIFDKNGSKIAKATARETINAFSGKTVEHSTTVSNFMLWSPETPYCYTAQTIITNEKGEVLDVVNNPLGFRWFSFDAAKGFMLNGAPYKLVGASRHQDYEGLGNAVPDELALLDMIKLKEMGANFLRVAHYPQDPSVLRACDSLGLLAAVEIPIVNEITEHEAFYRNSEVMQQEMIRQHFNHPSIIMWCYMNEVLLRSRYNDNKERQQEYYASIKKLAQRLEDLTRREDPYRYTMMANHGNLAQYKSAGLLEIPMVIGWNLYSGWYGGGMEDFPAFLDRFHKDYPTTPFMVTEYGADADPRIRSSVPVRFDKSIEYATRFHQYYFTEMMTRPYVAGAVVWNLADFNSETRTETMPHINNKGLLEWNRKPKDPYYFYQAMLLKKPFIKILGACSDKYGIADSSSNISSQPVQIASNLESVTVQLNGGTSAVLKITDGLCEWKAPFAAGENKLVVKAEKDGHVYMDSITANVHVQPHCLTDDKLPFRQINILLGSNRYFVDEKGAWWQPDQTYAAGGWGSVGGKRFKLDNNNRLPYGTDKNITGTNDDPIYQTQQTGIQQYRLNVPPGKYEVTLHFAELLGGKVRIPPYNLADDDRTEKIKRRIFNVNINGRSLLRHFNIAEEYGLSKAVTKTATVTIQDSEGIRIDFEPVEGEPVLNALQLKKIH